ncbi:MAG TPA: biliverdin-producing heme oxygenase [Arachnia sp.]|nr:biliverdin-producing heme oxygenase [Arachnia sp.]HMT86104.1 biliverdin-producing heme oxygenase [Arachnia sp.]
MTTQLAPHDLGLAARLRAETRVVHERAENSDFMARLARAQVTRQDLANLARQLEGVYLALEESARAMAGHPVFGYVHDPALERLDTLRADVAALVAQGAEEPVVLPAAQAYAARIRAVAWDAPSLVAHHYTRYLGDLSGGQALGALFGRALGLQPGEAGISFYHFAAIPKPKPYKDRYRAALDAAPMSEAQHDAVIAESIVAFRLNQDLFQELSALG